MYSSSWYRESVEGIGSYPVAFLVPLSLYLVYYTPLLLERRASRANYVWLGVDTAMT